MRILAIDPSKRSCGWACFSDKDERPAYGTWELGSEYTSIGKLGMNVHQNIVDLHRLGEITHIFYEDAFIVALKSQSNSFVWLEQISCIEAHIQSVAEALGVRQIRKVPLNTWRSHFVGSGEVSQTKRAVKLKGLAVNKKISASDALKQLVMERAMQLGFRPKNIDESDALGILDYACDWHGITPPWRRDNVLLPALGGL